MSTGRTALTTLILGAVVVGVGGCGAAAAQPAAPATLDNRVTGFKFQPTPQRVHVGDTVRWTNLDRSQHTSTSDLEGTWDSTRLDRNGVFEHHFTAAGDFKYHCAVHPFMHGEVIVERS